MEIKILITVLWSLIPYGMGQEDRTKLTHGLQEIDQVVIELDGDIEVNTWKNQELSIDYGISARGRVIGFSNKNKRPRYTLEMGVQDKRLSIKAKERGGLKAVGVVAYTETEQHVIYLPEYLHLIIKSDNGKIQVNGDFKKLTVETDGELVGRFRKSSINSLFCRADKRKLVINGSKRDEEYEFAGTGDNVYDVRSSKIRLFIDQ